MEQTLKDFGGRIIGYIETDSRGNKVLKDFNRRILGYYDAQRDVTQDFYRRIVAKGDCLTMLLK